MKVEGAAGRMKGRALAARTSGAAGNPAERKNGEAVVAESPEQSDVGSTPQLLPLKRSRVNRQIAPGRRQLEIDERRVSVRHIDMPEDRDAVLYQSDLELAQETGIPGHFVMSDAVFECEGR